MTTRGGPRPNAGRPKGGKNLRTIAATELLAEAQEKFPDFNPITALIALAQSAMAEDAEKPDPILAKDCLTAVLPYMAAKFRPIEADIDRVVDLEAKLARVKLEAQAQLLSDRPDLAERLARASQREIVVITGIERAPNEPAPEPIEGLADRLAAGVTYTPPDMRLSPPEEPQDAPAAPAAPSAGPAPAAPTAKPAAPPAPAPEPYRPILPEPAPLRFSQTMDPSYRPFDPED